MKVIEFNPKDGINAKSHRKEKSFMEALTLVAVYKGEIREIADLRIYGTQSKNYCCLWVHDQKTDTYCSGSGSAGGYGYHRPSAAAYEAFEKAGIKFDKSLSGCGDGAIKDALLAVGKKLGYRKLKIIEGHG